MTFTGHAGNNARWTFMPCECNCVVEAGKHWALCCRIKGRAHRNVDAVRRVRCTVRDGEYVGNAEQIRAGAPKQRGRDSGGRVKVKVNVENRESRNAVDNRACQTGACGDESRSPVKILAPPRARPRPFPPRQRRRTAEQASGALNTGQPIGI